MSDAPVLPGSTIGVLGSGQLGRMFAIAARRMGYRVHTLSPDTDTPTGQVADLETVASYDDLDAIRAFARRVDIVTFEFENVPAASADACAALVPVRPGGHALHTTQQRAREKDFVAAHGFPVVPFARASTRSELADAVARIGPPCVVKTAAFGYDGIGQQELASADELERVFTALGGQEAVVERKVSLGVEISVVAARGVDGAIVTYPLFENRHVQHVLDVTLCPARLPQPLARDAIGITRRLLELLDYVGVLCVEFFVTREGELFVNELAPRPHNSGHLTFDACVTSQFEQQVRAVCGLPLGSTELLRPAAMTNLLGDLWAEGEPRWPAALALSDVKLHLYGKTEPRRGRKMGHLTAFGATSDEAKDRALAARRALRAGDGALA